MRTPTLTLPLTLVAATLALSGCGKIEELTSRGKDDNEDSEPDDDEEQEEEKDAEPEPETEEERAEVEELPPVAVIEPPPPTEPLTGLDGLLAMLPADTVDPTKTEVLFVARDARVFADYYTEGTRFVEKPLERLAGAWAGDTESSAAKDLAEFKNEFDQVKQQGDGILAKFDDSGIHFDKGVMLFKVNSHAYLVYSSDNPDAAKELVAALGEESSGTACGAVEGHEGYAVCADDKATLDKYKPGGADTAKEMRAQAEKHLPGEDLENMNLLGVADGAWVTVATPPGLMVLSVAMPEGDADLEEFEKVLQPSSAKTLRAVQPGSGFLWMHLDMEALKQEEADIKNIPPPYDAAVNALDGEVLFAGHHHPSAISMQMGVTDVKALDPLVEMAEGAKGLVPTSIPDVEGSKVEFETLEMPVGNEKVKAVHLGVSGIPEADVLASFTGLTLDAYAFAANNTVTVALGASGEAIGDVAAAEGDGANDSLRGYLPPSLVKSLDAGEVSMIAHVPVDALQGPETTKLIEAAFKNVQEIKPEVAHAALALFSPLSSGTMWTTHKGDAVQIHVAMQGIGHHADDEGKAALDAAVAVAGGADPAATFGPLVTKYPESPRLASYKARSGQAPSALVASGVGAGVMVGAMGYLLLQHPDERNDAIAEELAVEEGAAEKAVEESKKANGGENKKKTPKKETPKKETPKTETPKKETPKKEETKTDEKSGTATGDTKTDEKSGDTKTDEKAGDTKTDEKAGDSGKPPKLELKGTKVK